MELTFPIYVLERDDFSFREFTRQEDLSWCERDDVLDGLHEGWDSKGRHFKVCWDDSRDLPTALIDQENSAGSFSDAIDRYAELCERDGINFGRNYKPKKYALCDPSYLRLRLRQIRGQTD